MLASQAAAAPTWLPDQQYPHFPCVSRFVLQLALAFIKKSLSGYQSRLVIFGFMFSRGGEQGPPFMVEKQGHKKKLLSNLPAYVSSD